MTSAKGPSTSSSGEGGGGGGGGGSDRSQVQGRPADDPQGLPRPQQAEAQYPLTQYPNQNQNQNTSASTSVSGPVSGSAQLQMSQHSAAPGVIYPQASFSMGPVGLPYNVSPVPGPGPSSSAAPSSSSVSHSYSSLSGHSIGSSPSTIGQHVGGHMGGSMPAVMQYENMISYQNSEQLHLLHQQQHLQLQEHQLQQKLLLIQQQQRMQQQLIAANQQYAFRSQAQQLALAASASSSSSSRPPQTKASVIDLSGIDSGDDTSDSSVLDAAEVRRATGFDEESLMLRPVEGIGLLSAYGAPLLPSLKLDSTMHRDYIAAVETVYQGGKGRSDEFSALLTALPRSAPSSSSSSGFSSVAETIPGSEPTIGVPAVPKGPDPAPASSGASLEEVKDGGEAGGEERKTAVEGGGAVPVTSQYWHDEGGHAVAATPADTSADVTANAVQGGVDRNNEDSAAGPSVSANPPVSAPSQVQETPMEVEEEEEAVETATQAEQSTATSSAPLPAVIAAPMEDRAVSLKEAAPVAAASSTVPPVPVPRPAPAINPDSQAAANPSQEVRMQQQQQLQLLQMMQPPVIKSFTPAGPGKKVHCETSPFLFSSALSLR